ncbi:unnamed protein product [Symbiodinium sp. CCMP2592]|nr:unnamed protein product [Symbiodinium sp. CCMP2592]
MMLKVGVQEIPQASIWQRLEQLTCNPGFDQKLHQLIDSFLLTTHPLADKQRRQYPREIMDFIDRYRVMSALAFSRVATLSGETAGAREKMNLAMSLVRHCMHFQVQNFKGTRETLSNDTFRLMGASYIPSPLASWNRNLIGYSSSTAEQRWLRTDTSIKHNDLTKLPPIEISRDAVNQAEAAKFFKGFLQLRPTLSFLPGSFLAIKALNRFPTLDSLKEQATHLEGERKEHGYDLPAVDASGIGEVAAFRHEADDENAPLMNGWISFMKALVETYPGRCVSIDDTLNWGASTPMTYEDGASQVVIRPTDGWVYVPAINSDIYDPQETYLHGTILRYLWSILAHGGLFGEDYVTDDRGSHEPCVWVTGAAAEAASSYASGVYLGGGYWFQVMICVSRTMVNTHGRTTKKLGGIPEADPPFRLLDDREQGVSTSPHYVIHGHRFLSADGTKAVAWHPWMEASPIDPRNLRLLGHVVANDDVEFADLTIQGGSTTQQVASTETEQPGSAGADDQAAAGGGETTERITVNPSVLRRNHWMPDSYGTSETANVAGRYALISELQSSCYRIELAPFFQLRAPRATPASSQGDGAADNDFPSTEPTGGASERAKTPPPPPESPPPPPQTNAPPRASEESAKEDDGDDEMEDDTVDQKPEQKPEEDADMGSGKELQDEVPGKGAVLSGARGPDVDIGPASTAADQAANDPRNCRIEGPGIKATTIHRPDQMPERGIDSIAPIVQYEMTSVPIALPDFVVPGLDMGIDDSVHGRLVSATCLPPTDEQRKFSRRRFAMISSSQTGYLNEALHKKPEKGDHNSFLRPESYEDCREIHSAVRAYNAKDAKYRSIGGTSVSCSRLLIDDAQNIPPATIPDAGVINLVRKLLFRVLTQTKEYPAATGDRSQSRPQDQERGVPLYSHFDQSGIIAFGIIPMYMEREREYMKANAGETSGRILLQTNILDENDEPTELTLRCIMELARTDNNRMFEFFYSTINGDGSPQFVGIRATYGFGPDNFNRFRLLTKCQHGPFIQLAQDQYVAGERRRNVARHHPQYGWGCATIREFFGFMSDCKINPPRGQLFLTLLPYAPGSGMNNEWEEVYMSVRTNPKRETLSNTASSQSMLPEGLGSNRMIVFAIDLHMIAAGINPIAFHPRGYYAIKDSIPLACMPIAYFMDTGTLVFNTAFKYIGGPKFGTGPERGNHRRESWPLASFDCPMCGASFPVGLHMCHSCTKPIHYPDGMFYADPVNPFQVEYYGSHADWLNDLIERNKLTEFQLHEYPAIKNLRNFPVSGSVSEDHRQTAFFGVPPIKCIAVDTTPAEVELFKKSVRGTIQGAIRLDIERLVAGITGKEARMGVEDFFSSQSIACAVTIVKHVGAVFATCREKPLCYYARWSIHCQRAYRVCLSRGYLSPFYTAGTLECCVDTNMLEKIRLAHLPLQNANLTMRRQIRLSTEFDTLDEFRATITDTQKYQRYMRVDSESLSALLAKVTLTTCYGIPIKGEPG